jgi:hypothetical protein
LVAFVISFIMAGMYWVGHRDVFGLIRRTDRGLVWLNLVYLLPLCLLPFGASLLGRFDREPVALRIYGLVLVAIAGMRLVIWWYATSRPHLLWQRLDDRQRRAGLALTLAPVPAYLLALLLAGLVPGVSLAIYGLPGRCGRVSTPWEETPHDPRRLAIPRDESHHCSSGSGTSRPRRPTVSADRSRGSGSQCSKACPLGWIRGETPSRP